LGAAQRLAAVSGDAQLLGELKSVALPQESDGQAVRSPLLLAGGQRRWVSLQLSAMRDLLSAGCSLTKSRDSVDDAMKQVPPSYIDGPTTFNQDARLLFEEIARGSAREFHTPNLIFCLSLIGAVSPDLICDALQAIVIRQSALRTAFLKNQRASDLDRAVKLRLFATRAFTAQGLFRQRVYDHSNTGEDFYEQIGDVSDTRVGDRLIKDYSRPFDLTRPPLMRVRLARREPFEQLLVFIVSPLVCDLWSTRVLQLELARMYGAAAEWNSHYRRTDLLHFAQQQQSDAVTGIFNASLAYWDKKREKFRHGHSQYLRFPRGVNAYSSQQSCQQVRINAAVSERIRQHALDHSLEVSSLVLAAWSQCLCSVTGTRTIVHTVPFANRSTSQDSWQVGCFANFHAIGLDALPGADLWEVARGAQAALKEAELHAAVPPPLIQNQAATSPAHADLMFLFASVSAIGVPAPRTKDGILLEPVVPPLIERIPLSRTIALTVFDEDDGLLVALNFDAKLLPLNSMCELLTTTVDMILRVATIDGAQVEPTQAAP
jgi:Condensation domain